MAQVVVADASVLIALAQIGQLSLLERLYEEVVIPSAVQSEVVAHAALDAGEIESISLALETRAQCVILDDLPARRLAEGLGLAVVGTTGVLFAAKQRG